MGNADDIQAMKSQFAIEFSDIKGETVRLKGFDEIAQYFKKQVSFWDDATKDKGNPAELRYTLNGSRNALSLCQRIKDIEAQGADASAIQNDWANRLGSLRQTLSSRRFVRAETPEADYLRKALNRGGEECDEAFKYLLTNDQLNTGKREAFEEYLRAYEFRRSGETETTGRVEAERIVLEDLRKELREETKIAVNSARTEQRRVADDWESVKKSFAEWKNVIETGDKGRQEFVDSSLKKLMEEHRSKLEEIEETYTKKLELEGPVRLWKARVNKYKTQANAWLWILAGTTVSVMGLLTGILAWQPRAVFREGDKFMVDPAALTGLLVIGTIVSFGAYLVRLAAKVAMSSMHLSRDAEEREQLTRVYLGLKKEGKIDTKDELLILDALFSRTQTGLLKDDSTPAMPGMGMLFEKFSGRTGG